MKMMQFEAGCSYKTELKHKQCCECWMPPINAVHNQNDKHEFGAGSWDPQLAFHRLTLHPAEKKHYVLFEVKIFVETNQCICLVSSQSGFI